MVARAEQQGRRRGTPKKKVRLGGPSKVSRKKEQRQEKEKRAIRFLLVLGLLLIAGVAAILLVSFG